MIRTISLAMLAFSLAAADLPVREVVLYKHGVGYFERAGQLAPGESARLDFKASEMNDVLKSLTIQERGGGRITGLRYDSSEPVSRKLAEFPFQLDAGQPFSAVLDQLKGARIELKFGTGPAVVGVLVGGRVVPGDDKNPERELVTLLLDNGELRSVYLVTGGSSVQFTDPSLQLQFNDYLKALADSRSRERRSVYIDSTDKQAREILAGYMIPVPVWKSSYRLVFQPNGQPTFEGWAIVDNTTGEDWTNIRLALVSGRPVSFVSRLYEPRYVDRPTAELAEDAAVAPTVYGGAVEDMKVASGRAGGRPMMSLAPPPPPPPAPKAEAFLMAPKGIPVSTVSTAAGRELGDLFEYRIATPVTVRKSQSAMLPFLQDKLNARKLLIYSDQSRSNPMNAAELTNTTGKTLDGGPITVYDGGAYGGEALVETLKAGDKRLISYAVDLGTRITTQFDHKEAVVREIHARRGVLTTRSAAVEARTYTVRNVDQKPKTLMIEHAARPQYNLIEPKAAEKTTNAYRFEVKLAANATEKFPVTEERVYEESVMVANLTPDVILTYVRNKSLSDAARKQLEAIAAQKQQLTQVNTDIERLETQAGEIDGDQERIRKNLTALNRVAGQEQQVQNYARQLAAQEGQLAGLRDKSAELKRHRAAVEAELNKLLEALSF